MPFTGSASYFYRDDSLQANTFTRNKSPNPLESDGPAPFNYNEYGYSGGGPIIKDNLFFFGAQEGVNFFQVSSASITVPSVAMRSGDFSELLSPGNPFFGKSIVINDPLTGQPFPNNVIPQGRLSPTGWPS
jgi:hypothetical protein